MKSTAWIFLVATATLLTGCIHTKTGGWLDAVKQPLDQTALLPIRAEDVENGPTNQLVRLGNTVLETLAAGPDSKLIAPSLLKTLIQSNGIPHALFDGILSPEFSQYHRGLGVTNDAAGLQSLEAFASQTGIRRVIRTQIEYSKKQSTNRGGAGVVVYESGGSVIIRMQLLNLSPAKVIAESESFGDFWDSFGVFLVIPVYNGTTLRRAVDDATRQAMVELFDRVRTQVSNPPDKTNR